MGPKFKNPLERKNIINSLYLEVKENLSRLSDCSSIILKPLTLHNKGTAQTVESLPP